MHQIPSVLKSSKLSICIVGGIVAICAASCSGCQAMKTSFKIEAFGVSFGMAFSPERVIVLPETNAVALVPVIAK